MKNFFQETKKSILLFIMAIVFCATWPFLMFFTWIKAVFSNKYSDSDKVALTKEVWLILGVFILFIVVNLISDRLSFIKFPIINKVENWLSNHWYLFVILFIVMGVLEHVKEKISVRKNKLSKSRSNIAWCIPPKTEIEDPKNKKI